MKGKYNKENMEKRERKFWLLNMKYMEIMIKDM
ncbi:MAG: hypothetical protein K0Q65_1086 [Clostridia bacterium]|nr:hypothetical protein [Clostridia bacterium]